VVAITIRSHRRITDIIAPAQSGGDGKGYNMRHSARRSDSAGR
jgi:hypothetical protein